MSRMRRFLFVAEKGAGVAEKEARRKRAVRIGDAGWCQKGTKHGNSFRWGDDHYCTHPRGKTSAHESNGEFAGKRAPLSGSVYWPRKRRRLIHRVLRAGAVAKKGSSTQPVGRKTAGLLYQFHTREGENIEEGGGGRALQKGTWGGVWGGNFLGGNQ